jgi:esterase/lipase superfamily enzyme
VQGLADGDENPNSIGPTGDALIFVHGYNNDMTVVLERMKQLRKDMKAEGWHGEIVAFDWPSNNQTLNYLEDRSDGAEVAGELVNKGIRLLSEGQKADAKPMFISSGTRQAPMSLWKLLRRRKKTANSSEATGAWARSPSSAATYLPTVYRRQAIGPGRCSAASCV